VVAAFRRIEFKKRRTVMNWDQIEGNWKQVKGKVKEKWGKFTDDELDVLAGKRDQLVGKVQERYGIAKADAERQVEEFRKAYEAEYEKSRGKTP
jgi:uncharacterized protein YjbJ (UPF0337 family)